MSRTWTYTKDEKQIICLSGNINTDFFYSDFMDQIYEYQFTERSVIYRQAPIISFEKAKWVESNVLPCFISIGIIMRNYYNEPCRLLFDYSFDNLNVLKFLTSTQFLFIAKYKLDVYDYDEEIINNLRFPGDNYNEDYKLECFPHNNSFYEKSPEEQYDMKALWQENILLYDAPGVFGKVLSKVLNVNQDQYDMCIRSVAEIIANAELYSLSDSIACVQARKGKIRISLCDVGIGFTRSLQLKKEAKDKNEVMEIETQNDVGDDFEETEKYMHYALTRHNKRINEQTIKDITAFLISLREAERSANIYGNNNLFRLIDVVTQINRKGIVKVHFNRAQLMFSYQQMLQYKMGIRSFIDYIIEDYNATNNQTLRIYKANIKGVHIEIEIDY